MKRKPRLAAALYLTRAFAILPAMPDESDPPRKFYGLKPKEFERVNDAPAEAAPADLRADPGVVAAGPARIDVRELARQASAGGPALHGGNAPANRANDVHAVLRENHAIATAAGLNEVAPRPRRSRRKRDYLVSLVVGNLVLLGGTWLSPIFGAAGLIIYNTGLTWIVWFVMDDY